MCRPGSEASRTNTHIPRFCTLLANTRSLVNNMYTAIRGNILDFCALIFTETLLRSMIPDALLKLANHMLYQEIRPWIRGRTKPEASVHTCATTGARTKIFGRPRSPYLQCLMHRYRPLSHGTSALVRMAMGIPEPKNSRLVHDQTKDSNRTNTQMRSLSFLDTSVMLNSLLLFENVIGVLISPLEVKIHWILSIQILPTYTKPPRAARWLSG